MLEPESEYLYIRKIEELERRIKLLQAILKAMIDGRTVLKKEIERVTQDDFSRPT